MKKTFWDKYASVYDLFESMNKNVYSTMLQSITKAVPENSYVLECAAGTGSISAAVSEKADRILCTDLSMPMLREARKKAEKNNIENIKFGEQNILNLTLKDESFDAVIAGNVIHLLDDPQKAFNELYRVTKLGGYIIIPTFLTGECSSCFKAAMKMYRLAGFRSKNYTQEEYKRLINSFEVVPIIYKMIKGRVPLGFAVFKK